MSARGTAELPLARPRAGKDAAVGAVTLTRGAAVVVLVVVAAGIDRTRKATRPKGGDGRGGKRLGFRGAAGPRVGAESNGRTGRRWPGRQWLGRNGYRARALDRRAGSHAKPGSEDNRARREAWVCLQRSGRPAERQKGSNREATGQPTRPVAADKRLLLGGGGYRAMARGQNGGGEERPWYARIDKADRPPVVGCEGCEGCG